MFAKILMPLVLATALAPNARAGSGFELRFGQRTNHGSFSIALFNRYHRDRDCEPRRCWVPAHYETRDERVWVEGEERRVWVAPVYDWRYDHCGRPYRVQLEVGHWTCVRSPGHFECRKVQVWVGGCWEDRRD